MSDPKYRAASVGGCVEASVEHRPDGTLVLRSTEPLRWFPDRLTDCLAQWAAEAPDRTLVARRGPDGQWIRISYAQMLQRAQSVGQALLDLGRWPSSVTTTWSI
jgi:feruloyl-CoA synthase